VFGHTTQVGVPIHLAGTPGAIKGPRPTPGQHNEEIFGELGYSAAEIAKFAGVA
jgi:crotonobetainyl-CoA:carnitine CoA-transferase CaiB-like acyl-CoA transferase